MPSTGSFCAMDDDIAACGGIVERGDPDRFRAVMATPVALRDKLFPLYAFNVEVARAPWVTQEEMIAEMRLQWWRDVLDEIRGGREVRRHEVATPLAAVVDATGAALLDQAVAARRWDIYRDPFEDMAQFCDHIAHTSGNLLICAGRAVADVPETVFANAGYAMGLANWLCAVPALERAGRIPLVEGTHDAVCALALDGLEKLRRARAGRASVPAVARPVLLAAWQAQPVLSRAVRNPKLVGDGQLDLSPMRSGLALMTSAMTGRW